MKYEFVMQDAEDTIRRLVAERDALAECCERLRAALRDCNGEGYNGQLDGHDPMASLREIQNIAGAALVDALRAGRPGTPERTT